MGFYMNEFRAQIVFATLMLPFIMIRLWRAPQKLIRDL